MGKLYAVILGLLLVMPGVLAHHNRYDPFVDLDTINWFDRALYQGAESSLRCLDLDEFYAYADSDPYDGLDRDDIELRDIKRLSYTDFLRVADANPYDNIDRGLFDDRRDFGCSTLREYEDFAARNRYDRFDREDYYRLHGFSDERDFNNRRRHSSYESTRFRPVYSDAYGRADGYGGYASWVR